MNDIRNIVDIAKALHTFVVETEKLGLTKSTFDDIAFIRPDINEKVDIIRDFFNDQPCIVIEEIPEISEPASVVVEKKTKSPTKKKVRHKSPTLDNKLVTDICVWVAQNCNGLNRLKEANPKTVAAFPDISDKTIAHILRKDTFKQISDKYFVLVDDVIRSVDYSGIKEKEKYKVPKDFKRKFSENITDDSFAVYMEQLSLFPIDVLIFDFPNRPIDQMYDLIDVEFDRVQNGLVKDLSKKVIGLLILKAVTKGYKKSTSIRRWCNSQYNFTPPTNFITEVLNHKVVPENFYKKIVK